MCGNIQYKRGAMCYTLEVDSVWYKGNYTNYTHEGHSPNVKMTMQPVDTVE